MTREITQLINNDANIFNNSYNWQNQKKKSNGKAQTLQQIHGKHNCQQEGTFIKLSKNTLSTTEILIYLEKVTTNC